MAKINELIERIDRDLNEIEGAESILKKAAKDSEALQKKADEMMKSANKQFQSLHDAFQKFHDEYQKNLKGLQVKHEEIIKRLEAFDLPDLKKILEEHKDELLGIIQEDARLLRTEVGAMLDTLNDLFKNFKEQGEESKKTLEDFNTRQEKLVKLLDANTAQLKKVAAQFSELTDLVQTSIKEISAISRDVQEGFKAQGSQIASLGTQVKKGINQIAEITQQESQKREEQYEQILQEQYENKERRKNQEAVVARRFRNQNILLSILLAMMIAVLLGVAWILYRTYTYSVPAESAKQETKQGIGLQKDSIIGGQKIDTTVVQKIPTPEVSAPYSAKDLMSPKNSERIIKDRSKYALTYLGNSNYDRLADKYFHPKGIHFYPFGMQASGKLFDKQTIRKLLADSQQHNWGTTGSTGTDIEMAFTEYHKRYVYDQNFLSAESVQYNTIALSGKSGLSAAQIAGKFSKPIFIEYIKNNRSLVLVFTQNGVEGTWYLAAVIHNE